MVIWFGRVGVTSKAAFDLLREARIMEKCSVVEMIFRRVVVTFFRRLVIMDIGFLFRIGVLM